ncbi:OprO/OprP family phosphate-selective porin [bacterium]|nr:OprO/OprP family phosphate-selective porin [bacterium]MBU1676616.1 OprO/OprP family phosphate-selective porin [bacterium]
MNGTIKTILSVFALSAVAASAARGGARLEFGDGSLIDLGFRLQFMVVQSQDDLDGDGAFENVQDFVLRRGRFRLSGLVNEKLSCFLQTAINGATDEVGPTMRMTDARIEYATHPGARFFLGLHKAPTSRQELTSAAARLAIDRPGLAGKCLNRGADVLTVFANATYEPGGSGLRGEEGARDMGVTLFGTGALAADVHLKYYLGVYDGIQAAGADAERYAGRVQLNFGDAEEAFSVSSYYLGGKNTVGLGLSYDTQQSVAADAGGGTVDYAMLAADVFLEKPLGGGTLTVEGGYTALDFGGAVRLVTPAAAPAPAVTLDLRRSQGGGFYAQASYLLGGSWQPWVEYESWTSDAADGTGGYTSLRLGLSYFAQGHNANLKLGVERFTPEIPFSAVEDGLTSAVCGVFLAY